jgi:signal transduction histidine kinase
MAAGNAPRVQNDIQRMAGAMDVMQERLDDLLELLRAGRVSDQLEVIPFNDLVAEALELVHGRLSQRGVRVRVDENLPSVTGNRRRLLEMMQNLMDNASKFMGDQTDPLIEICQGGDENGMPIFLVRDNGIGIPPEQHETIFGIFNKLNPKAEGTGIGLALVKKIIEIHGGRIWVESEAEKGSAFYFSLPRG